MPNHHPPTRPATARRRPPAAVQGLLPFAARARRRDRGFKRAILALTALAVVALVGGTAPGQFAAQGLALRARLGWRWALGAPPDRAAIEAAARLQRLHHAGAARRALARVAEPGSPLDAFLRAVGMDAGAAVVRWGNVDRPIVLSSAVFAADDDRAYRLRPGVRSVWVVGLSFSTSLAMFLIPDTPEGRAAAERVGGRVVPGSLQTTNSWGCRGPEPDAGAAVRLLVLGDSMMQGALVGDAETPPARLQARLDAALGTRTAVLNTGTLGYSPEQYYYTLRALGDRFRPHYVVISICANDFGTPPGWDEAEYWLDAITALCNRRGWRFLLVPAPVEHDLLGNRDLSQFPGQVSRIFKRGGKEYVDPLERFTDALLGLRNDRYRGLTVGATAGSADPLFNLHLLGDRHFSPLGCDLWAEVVARRLLLTWENVALAGNPVPAPVARRAGVRRGRP